MKTTSPAKIDLVARLAEIIEARKHAEKLEKDLKKEVKEIMGKDLTLEAGEFCVILSLRTRKDLNKVALEHDHGHAFVTKYTTLSSYEVLEVKSVKRAAVAL